MSKRELDPHLSGQALEGVVRQWLTMGERLRQRSVRAGAAQARVADGALLRIAN